VRNIVKMPEVRQRFAADSMLTRDMDSAALTAFLASELERWTQLVIDAGLRGK